ncbi:hypothetical protein B0T20DRAFT_388896 [Sordaria brevicollis]|uniref:Secreted protein n=1 Tax=Sordaria brevicollis TaxID=83679 RepID=A0AAE0UGF4_SORBR|nr:hypothetical protein B0T20DRAFT_388896 [Sordaria brevicollis]
MVVSAIAIMLIPTGVFVMRTVGRAQSRCFLRYSAESEASCLGRRVSSCRKRPCLRFLKRPGGPWYGGKSREAVYSIKSCRFEVLAQLRGYVHRVDRLPIANSAFGTDFDRGLSKQDAMPTFQRTHLE